MGDLRERIIAQLEEDWPTNVFCWELLENEIQMHGTTLKEHSYQDDEDDFGIVDGRYPEPGSAIRLAKECQVPQILPAAFYHLARIPSQHEWDNVRKDVSVWTNCAGWSRSARWKLLDAGDMMQLLRGRDILATKVQNIKQNVIGSNHWTSRCKSHQRCSEWRGGLWSCVEDECSPYDPLAALAVCHRKVDSAPEGCFSLWFPTFRKSERKAIWDEVPKMFGLL